jgi:hypothetical protein
MRTGFADEKRLQEQARALLETAEGKLRFWHFHRHPPYQDVPYDQRTTGDLLEEFYLVVAAEVDKLRGRQASLDAAELTRLDRLEAVLNPVEGADADSTGDPLADYWEYRATHGLSIDLDLNEAPPRELWDHPGEAA